MNPEKHEIRPALAMAAAIAGLFLSGAAPAAEILGHRAVYKLSLAASSSNAKVASLEGYMLIEWTDSCEVYTLHQEVVMRYFNADGGSLASVFSLSSSESRSGDEFRFSSREEINDELSDVFEGKATLRGPGQGGRVVLTSPDGRTRELPSGTIFPTAHSLALIDHARDGDRLVYSDLFDGSSGVDSLYGVSAFIGDPVDNQNYAAEKVGSAHLRDVTSWPVHLAYYSKNEGSDAQQATPEYEVEFHVFANGIVTDMKLDYGNIEVNGELGEIKVFPDPDC